MPKGFYNHDREETGWSEEAEQWLRDNYVKLTGSQVRLELARLFDLKKTRSAVCGKAARLGLSGNKPRQPYLGKSRKNAALVRTDRKIAKPDAAKLDLFIVERFKLGYTDDVIAAEAAAHFNYPLAKKIIGERIVALGLRQTVTKRAASKALQWNTGKSGAFSHGDPSQAKPPKCIDLDEPAIDGIPFLDRERDQCAWPIRDGFACGAQVLGGLSYCPRHSSRSYSSAPSGARLLKMQAEQVEYRKSR